MQVIHTIEGRYQTIFRQYHFYINFFATCGGIKITILKMIQKKTSLKRTDGHKQKGRKTN